jgi:hypothetical protein
MNINFYKGWPGVAMSEATLQSTCKILATAHSIEQARTIANSLKAEGRKLVPMHEERHQDGIIVF